MVNWTSPESLAIQASAFTNLNHALFGLFVYEYFMSIDFDWSYVTGERKFHLPAVVYLANRYLLLFAMIGIIISLDTTSEINCQVLYTFNQLAGDAAVGLASANLALRTVAVWSFSKPLMIGLILLGMGHWSLILQGVQLKASWVDGVGCVITETNNKILAAIFIYSMCFDLIIVILTTIKLWKHTKTPSHGLTLSRLPVLLFKQGLIFFIVAFLVNLVASIFMVLSLSPIMTVMFNVPAAVFSTIVACRSVRALSEYNRNLLAEGSGGAPVDRAVPSRERHERDSRLTPAVSGMTGWLRNVRGRREMPRDVMINVSTNYTENVDPCDDKRPRNDSATDLHISMDSKTSRL
ncbi:hypothetical protein BKA70DRAFT_1466 [Coprinopsis sp. MPI-PUGE-AT-0042]|nr:hypothetical protein BKA70DRAFT_1466 [Coprinopsis sp. MPI-PUGE-AT-0042]